MNQAETMVSEEFKGSPRDAESPPAPGLRPGQILFLATWLGVVAGLLELAAFLLVTARRGDVWSYVGKIRHYPWTIPLVDAGLLFSIALPLALVVAARPAFGRRAAPTLLVACAFMPTLMLLAPNIYAAALFLVALGLARNLVPLAERRREAVSRFIRISLPISGLILVGIAAARELPGRLSGIGPAGADGPNVLLVVLDTVRADHLNLDESADARPTSPELARFARRGVRVTGARATAPWTLPSHASLLTGLWSFQACPGRFSPMAENVPTLAGALGGLGYDTVGISANTYYCTYSTGLARDFSRFEDHPFTLATTMASAVVGGQVVDFIGRRWPGVLPDFERFPRVRADSVNRRFLGWLDRRGRDDRPFFALLNYFDAHDPYLVPDGVEPRFGAGDHDPETRRFLEEWWLQPDKQLTTSDQLSRLIDGYDSCIAYLDDRLGSLFRELDRRGILEETLVVVTSDHGEAFGEHGLFGHGGSLYEDQLHVPLILVGPGIVPEGLTLDEVVSLRDVPATILDLVGHPAPPLPGTSLTFLWRDSERATSEAGGSESGKAPSPAVAMVPGPDQFPPNQGRSPVFRGPMLSITEANSLKYIRIERGMMVEEEAYHLAKDPGEEYNLASPLTESLLAPLRQSLLDAIRPQPPGGGR